MRQKLKLILTPHGLKKLSFTIFFPEQCRTTEPIWAFFSFKMKMYLKCHIGRVIHHYLRVSMWMCRMIDTVLVLEAAWQHKHDRKWQWRQQIKGRRGWTGKRPMHKRCKDRGRHGGGVGRWGFRETKMEREKERTRDASLQMRGLEARRQFKPALAPSQAWQTAHSYPLSFTHTPTRTHIYMHTQASHACWHTKLRKKIKQETLREHKCADRVSTVRMHILYMRKLKIQQSVNYTATKTLKSPADRAARGCLSKQQFTYTHLCSCTFRLQWTWHSVMVFLHPNLDYRDGFKLDPCIYLHLLKQKTEAISFSDL